MKKNYSCVFFKTEDFLKCSVLYCLKTGKRIYHVLKPYLKNVGAGDTDQSIYIVYEKPGQSLLGSARVSPVSHSILTDVGFFDRKIAIPLDFWS
jgi:hypothetical protein